MSEYITGHENADQDTDCIMFSNAFYTDMCRHTKRKETLLSSGMSVLVEWDECPFQRQLTHRTFFVVTLSHMERHFVLLKWKRDFYDPASDDGISDAGSDSDGDDFGPDVTGSGSDSDSDSEEEQTMDI